MQKKRFAKALSYTLAATLALSLMPIQSFADHELDPNDPTAMTASDTPTDEDAVIDEGAQADDAHSADPEDGDGSDGYAALAANGLPSEELPLAGIIADDQMYTTLFDEEHRVVSTNDPEVEQDAFYAEGGTVDRGAQLYVHFRMASIKDNDTAGGIREDVAYYMEELPGELVPDATDSDGNKVVDPETPFDFIRTAGSLNAHGGIYSLPGDPGSYNLKISFDNVVNRHEISGTFQYGATVSEELTPGEAYEFTYVPGGTVGFTVTPEEPVETPKYRLSMRGSAGSGTDKHITWTVTLEDLQDTPSLEALPMTIDLGAGSAVLMHPNFSNSLPNMSMTVTYKDGSTQTLPYTRMNADAWSFYEQGTTFNPTVTANGSSGVVATAYTDYNGADAMYIRQRYYLATKVYLDFGSLKHESFGNSNGGESANPVERDIVKYELTFDSTIYNDYNILGSSYTATATLAGGGQGGSDLTATGGAGRGYGSFSTPQLAESLSGAGSTSDPYSYEYLPSHISSRLVTETSSYTGNYYWFEYKPQYNLNDSWGNSLNANYYSNYYSLVESQLVFSGTANTTFTSFSVGGNNSWSAGVPIQASYVKDLSLNSSFANNGQAFYSSDDLVVPYQMQQIFKDMPDNTYLIIHRSTAPVNGRYIYIVIDPGTYADAFSARGVGWGALRDGSGTDRSSQQPKGWRIHVFNAPGTSATVDFDLRLGSLNASDANSGGSITDSLRVGYQSYNASRTTGAEASVSSQTYQAASVDGYWMDGETIFWQVRFDTTNWQKNTNSTTANWSNTYYYLTTDNNQELAAGTYYKTFSNSITGNQRIDTNHIYAYNPGSGSWATIGAGLSSTSTQGRDIRKNTNLPQPATGNRANTYSNLYGGMQSFTDSNNDVVIGFFTHVKPGTLYSTHLECDVEIVAAMGDAAWSHGATTCYPFHVNATGRAVHPYANKRASQAIDVNGPEDEAITAVDWRIIPVGLTSGSQGHTSSPNIDTFYGAFNGTLTFTDDMRSSSNTASGASSADYTHITRMFSNGLSISELGNGGGCGPIPYADSSRASGWYGDASWEKGTPSGSSITWTSTGTGNLWEPREPGIYRHSSMGGVEVYVYYSGDMNTSFSSTSAGRYLSYGTNAPIECTQYPLVIQYTGFSHGTYLSDINYRTEFDNKEYLAALAGGDEPDADFSVTFTNAAATSMQRTLNVTPARESVERRIVAALAVEKTAGKVNRSDYGDGTMGKGYEISARVGFSPSAYVGMEDFITKYAQAGTDYDSDEQISELLACLYVDNLSITVTDPSTNEESEIYSGSGTAAGFAGTPTDEDWVIDFEYKPSDNSHPGSLFSFDVERADGKKIAADTQIKAVYDLSINMDGVGGFRSNELYQGGTIDLFNNVEAARPYISGSAGGQSTQQAASVPTGRTRLAAAALPLMRAARTADDVLVVEADSSVNATYLSDPIIRKNLYASDDETQHWIAYDWTGTKGIDPVTARIKDALHYDFTALTYRDPSTGATIDVNAISDETEQANITAQLEYLIAKHTTFSNFKVYLGPTKHNGNPEGLDSSELVWDLGDFSFTGATPQDGFSTSAGGHSFTLVHSPASLDTNGSEWQSGHMGFEVTATDVDRAQYLSCLYDTKTDWNGFFREALQLYPRLAISYSRVNDVFGYEHEEASHASGETVVQEAGITKRSTNVNSDAGTAQWIIEAKTGLKASPVTITDTVAAAEGTSAQLKEAAEAATYVKADSVIVSQGSLVLYRNGALTDAARQAGWTDDNITVAIDGRSLSVTLSDADDSQVLADNQSFTVDYRTAFDQDAFVRHGGMKNDSYTLENTAQMDYAHFNGTATAKATHKPNLPVSASKQLISTDGNSATWSLNSIAMGSSRKNYTLSDTVQISDEAAQQALAISNMTIYYHTGSEGSLLDLDNLPEGITITDQDGNPFELDKVGTTGFTLVTDECPPYAQFVITYDTVLDRDAYIAAGGSDETPVNLKNTLNVSTADGYTNSAERSTTVQTEKPFVKEGMDAGTSENGNPLLKWSFDVKLTDQLSAADLTAMQTASIKDTLSPLLRFVEGSVTATDSKGRRVDVIVETAGRTVTVNVPDPAAHPNLTITFLTECLASAESISNSADLVIDGTIAGNEEATPVDDIKVGGIFATIRSVSVDSFTPVAWKYLDNELCTIDGAYEFEIVAVDEDGTPLDGEQAYSETAQNDGEGRIQFSKITFTQGGDHYFKVRELGEDVLDNREFTLLVSVDEDDGDIAVLSSDIVAPENYAQIRFDNTTKPKTCEFSVEKVWDDNNNASGKRPDSITVFLMQDGQPYNGMSATLSEANGWAYTWTDLPIAGGDYSVAEAQVNGYTASYDVRGDSATITNTLEQAAAKPGSKLPGTGQVAWPIAVLALLAAAAAAVFAGTRRKTGRHFAKRS